MDVWEQYETEVSESSDEIPLISTGRNFQSNLSDETPNAIKNAGEEDSQQEIQG